MGGMGGQHQQPQPSMDLFGGSTGGQPQMQPQYAVQSQYAMIPQTQSQMQPQYTMQPQMQPQYATVPMMGVGTAAQVYAGPSPAQAQVMYAQPMA